MNNQELAPVFSPTGPEARPEWSTRLVVDVVLGTSTESILEAHGLVHHQFEAILRSPAFVLAVADMRKNLEKEGATFKFKAGIQADMYLVEAHKMIMDPTMDPKVRTRLIEDTVRWAGFDAPAPVGAAMGGFSVSINFGTHAKQGTTIDAEDI